MIAWPLSGSPNCAWLNEFSLFRVKAIPLLIVLITCIDIAAVCTTFNAFSYGAVWADNWTHHLPNSGRMRYLLRHRRGWFKANQWEFEFIKFLRKNHYIFLNVQNKLSEKFRRPTSNSRWLKTILILHSSNLYNMLESIYYRLKKLFWSITSNMIVLWMIKRTLNQFYTTKFL